MVKESKIETHFKKKKHMYIYNHNNYTQKLENFEFVMAFQVNTHHSPPIFRTFSKPNLEEHLTHLPNKHEKQPQKQHMSLS